MKKKDNYVKTGMAIGAGLGALSGFGSGEEGLDGITNVVGGAVVGGFAGAVTGYAVGKVVESLDQLEKQPKKKSNKFGGGYL